MRSFVENRANQRWLWHAIDHKTGKILAHTFGKREDEVFVELRKLPEPFGIRKFYTDGLGTYARKADYEYHEAGKRNTQKTERRHLTLRTRKNKTSCAKDDLLLRIGKNARYRHRTFHQHT